MAHELTAAASYEERLEDFHEMYGNDRDPADALAALPERLFAAMAPIIGDTYADGVAAAMVSGLLREDVGATVWRDRLERGRYGIYSECPAGPILHDLYAYARYGIALTAEESADGRRRYLGDLVARAAAIRAGIPDDMLEPGNDLDFVLDLALGRWALDNDEPLSAAQFAKLAGLSEGRVRNMMSGAREIPSRDGKIAAADARNLLAKRAGFLPSIWQERVAPSYEGPSRPPMDNPVFVPVARDGTAFHPGLIKAGSYTVGEKGAEIHVETFADALAALQAMPVPYWRRPNEVGNWGIVAGVRWARLDASDLEVIARDPSHKIPETV